MRFFLFVLTCVGALLSSCSNDNFLDGKESASELKSVKTISGESQKEIHLINFARILSKVVYERQDVREFLKQESLKQFDKNYDVLYYLVKDEIIGGISFRDILISFSSEESIQEIELAVPLLNILIPQIEIFDIKPENLDITDKEIPVVVSKELETSLFLAGKEEVNLEKGEIPDFHVFVVNENSRVILPVDETRNLRSGSVKSVIFKSPNFDSSIAHQPEPSVRSILVNSGGAGQKAIDAFSYFNQDNGTIYQRAFQRDYIYYGITPTQKTGSLNRSVSEYISYLEINPKAYFKIADQINTGSTNDDPYIKETVVTQKKRELSEEELLDRMWTKGAYDFRFEIITSTNQHPQIVYVPLKPNEIWNFNIEHTRVHGTAFRSSKNTYKIDPNKFTSKRVPLGANQISFGKWNLAEESIYRYVNILEEDESSETKKTYTYESTRVKTSKFNGDVKLQIGLGTSDNITGGTSSEVTNSNTTKDTKTVEIVRKERSDDLGSIRIYFYEPIIESKVGSMYSVRTYNTGYVNFAISVK